MEHKLIPSIMTKVDAEQGLVEHIVSVVGNIDQGKDRITPGAFAKTLAQRGSKVRVLDQHNTDSIMRVLGKPIALREIGPTELPPELKQAFPSATGALLATTQFLLDTPEGKGAFERIKQGAVDEWSIGFDAIETSLSEETMGGRKMIVRNIKELRLWEYSPVLWGMNEATMTLDAKAQDKEMTGEGPVQRCGDVMAASIYSVAASMITDWLGYGRIDRDTHRSLMMALDHSVESFLGAFPEGLLDQMLGQPLMMDDLMMMLKHPGQSEVKIGRRFSAASITAMENCINTIESEMAKLKSLYASPEDEGAKAGSDPAEHTEPVPEDPPAEAPTAGMITRSGPDPVGQDPSVTLALIDLELETLAVLEV